MKCTKIILSGLMAITATAHAMPTPEETKKVEPLVADLMRDAVAESKGVLERIPAEVEVAILGTYVFAAVALVLDGERRRH